jgi:CheY-like chemotaxis protein
MDGIEATRCIRRRELERILSRTPIVALSASAALEEQEQGAAAGMDEWYG